ncbi:hypothetical protein HAX54_016614 [Datura stramonium]|uniref:Uncharacterized protein n=1 Tax=Datura stramonium TaxID=4076 RepID=A0ABS8UKP5_DATST|nr:hypothetical protein [Datura stramonium]
MEMKEKNQRYYFFLGKRFIIGESLGYKTTVFFTKTIEARRSTTSPTRAYNSTTCLPTCCVSFLRICLVFSKVNYLQKFQSSPHKLTSYSMILQFHNKFSLQKVSYFCPPEDPHKG